MGADETGSRFYECEQCWSLVREASREAHGEKHALDNRPRFVDCGVCRATVHVGQRGAHKQWHDGIERQIRDLATGPTKESAS